MNKSDQLWKSLEDEEYRRAFIADDTGLAFQIKLLRDKKGWTQAELGDRAGGKRQETISQWENPNYGKYSLSTLKDLAAAFDVGMMVRFAPFSELVEWNANLTLERIAPPSFDEEANVRYQPSQIVPTAQRGKPSTIAANDDGFATEMNAITATHIEPSAHPADAVFRWVMGGTAIEPKESDSALAA